MELVYTTSLFNGTRIHTRLSNNNNDNNCFKLVLTVSRPTHTIVYGMLTCRLGSSKIFLLLGLGFNTLYMAGLA